MIQYHLLFSDWRELFSLFIFRFFSEKFFPFSILKTHFSLLNFGSYYEHKLHFLRYHFFSVASKIPLIRQLNGIREREKYRMLNFLLFVWKTSHEATHDLSYKVCNEKNLPRNNCILFLRNDFPLIPPLIARYTGVVGYSVYLFGIIQWRDLHSDA